MGPLELKERVVEHLQLIYQESSDQELADIADRLLRVMRIDPELSGGEDGLENSPRWNSADAYLITYGDSIVREHEKGLHSLNRFLHDQLSDLISAVHILPFFPYTSDDGFAVLDFTSVNESIGDWQDIEDIAQDFLLMSDLVINHMSSRSAWFMNFQNGISPGKGYFVTANPDDDLSAVVRPRTSDLLREVETSEGTQHVWCTFSHDQVDLNFSNPEVLIEFASIIRLYLDHGVRVFRLDAIAFLWKEIGTNCVHLPQTHEIVRLLRTLVVHCSADALLITETNVPSRENLSYFGNGNEAHMVYNFPLPPLLFHTLLSGECHYLTNWLMSLPAPPLGTTYFNFIASHDGIGMRPVEGILCKEEQTALVDAVQRHGGQVSFRHHNGDAVPYELNIALWDAFQGSYAGPDEYQFQRFISAHAIMLALEGIPAFYIHSLLATPNDSERMEHTGNPRSINRHRWDADLLDAALADEGSNQSKVLAAMKRLLRIRRQQSALHPNAAQYVLQLGNAVFGVWRRSLDGKQTLYALNNVTDVIQQVNLRDVNLEEQMVWRELITDKELPPSQDTLQLLPYQSVWLSHDDG